MRPPSFARAKETRSDERNEGARGDLALALDLRMAELRLGNGVVPDRARGSTIDNFGPVLAYEGDREQDLIYCVVRRPEDEAALAGVGLRYDVTVTSVPRVVNCRKVRKLYSAELA